MGKWEFFLSPLYLRSYFTHICHLNTFFAYGWLFGENITSNQKYISANYIFIITFYTIFVNTKVKKQPERRTLSFLAVFYLVQSATISCYSITINSLEKS